MLEGGAVAGAAVGLLQVLERGAGFEIPIGRVHAHHAMPDLLEERQRIVAADDRVGRVVLDAEVRVIDLLDDLEEHVLGLRELRVRPVAVLVVVLHAQHDVAFGRVLERRADALDGPLHALGARHARQSLAAERAAMPQPERHRHVDGGLLPLHLPPAFVGVRMREIGREAQQRGRLPRLLHHLAHARGAVRPERRQEAVVVLDALAAERLRITQPLEVVHAAGTQLVEVALGEDGNSRWHEQEQDDRTHGLQDYRRTAGSGQVSLQSCT